VSVRRVIRQRVKGALRERQARKDDFLTSIPERLEEKADIEDVIREAENPVQFSDDRDR
jgi:hypothetical protein